MGVDEFGEAAAGDLLGDVAEGEEADPADVDLERAGFGGGPHVLDDGERLADRPVSPQLGGRPGDADRRVQDPWWVRSTSEPWAHSLPTMLPQFDRGAGWSSSGRTFSTGQTPRTAAVRDYPTTGSLRVLSRNRRRGLARNGPLGAAMELPGGCRRRAPTRLIEYPPRRCGWFVPSRHPDVWLTNRLPAVRGLAS